MKFFALLVTLFCCLQTGAYGNSPYGKPSAIALDAPILEGEVPWPWGSELPFPWESIAGTWSAENEKFYTWFSFEVYPSQNGANPLIRVRQVDPLTRTEVASGIGFEDNKIVKAYMVGKDSRYFISVRAYRTDTDHGPALTNSVTVLSISSAGTSGDFMYHLVLSKLSDKPIGKD